MSACAPRASARQRPEKKVRHSPNALNFDGNELRDLLGELLLVNSRSGGGSADLP